MKSKHYPYFKHHTNCIHCGQPIMFQKKECLYIHEWERWGEPLGYGGKHDNGYYCREDTINSTTATPPEGWHDDFLSGKVQPQED